LAGVVMGATCYDMTAKRTRAFLRHGGGLAVLRLDFPRRETVS